MLGVTDRTLRQVSLIRRILGEVIVRRAVTHRFALRALIRQTWSWPNAKQRIPVTPGTRFRMCSITEQFTCSLVLDRFPDPSVLDSDVRAHLPLLEQMMAERGLSVDYSTIDKWVQRSTPEIENGLRWHWRRPRSGSWWVNEAGLLTRVPARRASRSQPVRRPCHAGCSARPAPSRSH